MKKTMLFSGLIRLITKSGIITSNLRFYSGNRFYTFFRRLFFLRCSPLVLNKVLDSRVFTNIISTLSIGPTHKTTEFGRHDALDKIMFSFMDRLNGVSFADIGVSDGVSSLRIYSKVGQKIKNFYLLDKYNYFNYAKKWYGYNFYNTDSNLVYVQVFNFFLLHVFGVFYSRINGKYEWGSVSFDNPLLKEKNLKVIQFDLFKGQLGHKLNIVKCANVLNSPYFSNEQIIKALRNINKNMLEGGYLFVMHNNKKYKGGVAMLVLQKNKEEFKVVLNYHDHELGKFAEKLFMGK